MKMEQLQAFDGGTCGTSDLTDVLGVGSARMHPYENKFHAGNGEDGKHYWLTPPDLFAEPMLKEIEDLRFEVLFYKQRCEALQEWQSKMRDPERTIVCDILANGATLHQDYSGDRYKLPPNAEVRGDAPPYGAASLSTDGLCPEAPTEKKT